MRVTSVQLDKLQRALDIFGSLRAYRRRNPTSKAAVGYFELLYQYWEQLLRAAREGKPVVAHSVLVPSEILYAMDIVPFHLEMVISATMIVLKEQESYLAAAKAYGLTPEVCSTHRSIAAAFASGWAPRPDAVVWTNQVCDNTAKSNEAVADCYGIPGFYYDVPYQLNQRSLRYLAGELEELIQNLEQATGRKMDPARLVECLRYAKEQVDLSQEIHRLRGACPTPGDNRLGSQLLYTGWYWMGTPTGVEYFRAVRDELKEKVAAGVGGIPQEKFRLLSLFVPMGYHWKILDWMERAHGAVIVAEPYCTHWNEVEWDFSQPLLTLARRIYAHPIMVTMHGPVSEGLAEVANQDARECGAQGAIYWAHIGCRQACAVIRTVKDALSSLDIPLLTLDIDINDPTFVSDDQLKDKLEGFLEMLEENR